MKYVVTGGAGFVGNNIVKLLVDNGHEVIVVDNLHTGKMENLEDIQDQIEFYDEDIRNVERMEKILQNTDGVFHQAALTIVQESFSKEQEYFDVNVRGTENIFKIAKKFRIKVIFASSSSVYGNAKTIPIKEEFDKKPINPYGKTKLEDEFLAEKFWEDNSEIIGLRYFNIFGKGQTGSYAGVITKFLENIKLKNQFKIFGDGTQIRDFIHVKDIAKANLAIMESKTKDGFFNIGTGKATSIKDLAKIMIEISDHKQNIEYLQPLEGDVKESQADTSLTKRIFDWEYSINLRDGLNELINQIR